MLTFSGQAFGWEYDKLEALNRGRLSKCSEILKFISSSITQQIANKLDLNPQILISLLEQLDSTNFYAVPWKNSSGLVFVGSRVHKYWGYGYDIDLLFLPKTEEMPKKFEKFFDSSPPVDVAMASKNVKGLITSGLLLRPQALIQIATKIDTQVKELKTLLMQQENIMQKMSTNISTDKFSELKGERDKLNKIISEQSKTKKLFQIYGTTYDFDRSIYETYLAEFADLGADSKLISPDLIFLFKDDNTGLLDAQRVKNLGFKYVYILSKNGLAISKI